MRVTLARGDAVGSHAHLDAQLLFTISGTVQVQTATGRWLAPPHRAVWAPGAEPHAVEALSAAELWSVYYHPRACQLWARDPALQRPSVLRMTPFLRALLHALFNADPAGEPAELMVRLILHALTGAPDTPTFLPLPASLAARRVADLALADPACRLDLAALAAAGATSPRTVSRLFTAETGLSFKAWRQRARIVAVIDRLATGASIATVTTYAGFASPAALAYSFRQVTGETITRFMAPA